MIGSSRLGLHVSLRCTCVCVYAWTLTHTHFTGNSEFIPVALANTCSSVIIVEKDMSSTKSRQYSTVFHRSPFFMHISKQFDDSLNMRLYTQHIYHFFFFLLCFTIIFNKIIFMSRIFHIALKHKTFGTTTATTI